MNLCTARRIQTTLVLLGSVLWGLGCSRSESRDRESQPASPPSPDVQADVQADDPWVRHILDLRGQKDREFKTSSTSPMAGTQFLKSQPGTTVHLSRDGQGRFELADAVNARTVVSLRRAEGAEEVWTWTGVAPGVVAKQGGQALDSGAAVDNSVTFAIDRFTVSIYPTADTVTFKVFDPRRKEFTAFQHLEYYPPDRRFAVAATLEKTESRDPVIMLTSQNLEKTFYPYAEITFQLEGKDLQLSAFKYALSGPGAEYLFIPYKDTTNGRETYGAGRYLEFKEPESKEFTLDFNESYNPLCNYSDAYNCPIPPRQNRLQVAIRAGEMTYPH